MARAVADFDGLVLFESAGSLFSSLRSTDAPAQLIIRDFSNFFGRNIKTAENDSAGLLNNHQHFKCHGAHRSIPVFCLIGKCGYSRRSHTVFLSQYFRYHSSWKLHKHSNLSDERAILNFSFWALQERYFVLKYLYEEAASSQIRRT